MRIPIAALASAAVLAPAACALAQEGEPGEPGVQLDVRRVSVPQSTAKLVERGVRVRAACTPECVIVVKVSLPAAVARKLGLGERLIASGVGASAGGPVWVRARLRRAAAERLEGYGGGGRLQVRVRALP